MVPCVFDTLCNKSSQSQSRAYISIVEHTLFYIETRKKKKYKIFNPFNKGDEEYKIEVDSEQQANKKTRFKCSTKFTLNETYKMFFFEKS